MKELKLKAMAKINLGLDVLRRREDGYHELRMIMQTVRLYDRVQLTVTEAPGIRVKTNLSFLSTGEDNLVYRAARLLMEEFQISKGLFINLEKHIPVAAGLAGGSSDAAAVLVGVNRLFRLGLSREELMERGVKLGADVPYCILRGTALAEGIGEKLTPLPSPPACHVLLAKPKIHVSTKFVYGNLRADQITEHPDVDGQIRALDNRDLHELAALMGNVLETVTIPAYPVIQELKDEMMRMGAVNSMMSGSGPTVFGLFEDRAKARKAYEKLKRGSIAKQVYLTEFFCAGGGTQQGNVQQGKVQQGDVQQGKVQQGDVQQGKAQQGSAQQDGAYQGSARTGKRTGAGRRFSGEGGVPGER